MPNSLKCKIKHLRHNGTLTERERDRILKALKQEDVLEKIRAEIEELKNAPPCFDDMFEYKYAVDEVLAIIDKYKNGGAKLSGGGE